MSSGSVLRLVAAQQGRRSCLRCAGEGLQRVSTKVNSSISSRRASSSLLLAGRQAAVRQRKTNRRTHLLSSSAAASETLHTSPAHSHRVLHQQSSCRRPLLVTSSTSIQSTAAAAACATTASQAILNNDDEESSLRAAAAIAAAAAGLVALSSSKGGAALEDEEDSLHTPSPITTTQCEAATAATTSETTTTSAQRPQPRNVMLHRMRSVRARGLNEKYKVDWDLVLGEGAYGAVYPARLATTREKVALKKISRRYTNLSSFKTETDALLRIFDNGGHPNISGLRDMYEDHNSYYLILDLVTGGEMFEHLINFGAYSEADAARLIHEVASALAFLHGVGVVHADLKPENLLLSTKNRRDGTIKLIDFGCAVVQDLENDVQNEQSDFKSQLKSASSTGTTAYWPPERFDKSGSQSATVAMDMWSVGVICFIMLTGVHPFDTKGVSTDEEIEQQIQECDGPPLDPELVGHLSESAIDLICKLMEKNPDKRMTAYQMLHHPWVRGETALRETIPDSDKKLSRFQDLRYKLEASFFSVLVSQSHPDVRISEAKIKSKDSERPDYSAHVLKRAFDIFDAEGKGYVSTDDLERVTKEHTGSTVSSSDTEAFLATQSGGGHAHASPDAEDSDGFSSATSLSLSQFTKLFSGLHQRHFPRGHYIFHAGDRGNAMYFLSSGKVEIQTRKGQLVSLLRSGDFFGEGSLLDKTNRRFTSAKCATPVDVLEIRREDFERYIGSSEKAKRALREKWRARSLTYGKNLLRLQKNVKTRLYNKGDVVYREGDLGKSMFRVHDTDGGVLSASHATSHGEQVVHQYVGGDSFGESSLLFSRPRSSTVTCASDECRVYEMKGKDFLNVVNSSPEMAHSLQNMCRKRLFKRAVKAYSLSKKRGLSDADIVAAFHDADIDNSGSLNLDEVRRLMHRMDPNFPMAEIRALLKFVDVDEDGSIKLEEFKRLFRQFEDEKED